jgi:hypothetical protein
MARLVSKRPRAMAGFWNPFRALSPVSTRLGATSPPFLFRLGLHCLRWAFHSDLWPEGVDCSFKSCETGCKKEKLNVDHDLIFSVYDHIIAVCALIIGVYALIFSVYEGIFGNYEGIFDDYELIHGVYDLIFGVYEGRIAGNEGIFGVLEGIIGVLQPENRSFWPTSCAT